MSLQALSKMRAMLHTVQFGTFPAVLSLCASSSLFAVMIRSVREMLGFSSVLGLDSATSEFSLAMLGYWGCLIYGKWVLLDSVNTPADKCGIKVEGENKWLTIIQNAAKKEEGEL